MTKLILAAACLATTLAAGTATAQTATYAIDPTHTFANFEVSHFGTSTLRGRFDKKEGTVQFDRAGKTGKLDLTIDMTSVSTGVPALDKHLQSKDFFNAAEHATARFVADRFSFDGDKVTSIAGTLTMLGKTGPVTLAASRFNCYMNPLLKREVCGGDFSTTIKRSAWGMGYGLDFGIPDEVKLVVQAEAVKQ
jgi:polyisoprenoid-binding protein YceI